MKALVIILSGILLVLQYQVWVGDGSIAELQRLEADVEERRQENERLDERNRELENEVLALKEGLDAIEERARTDLGMIRDDETFYLIIE
ncbi:MAG: cell division protein FtsB [Pseudohongiellaceae bacterium]